MKDKALKAGKQLRVFSEGFASLTFCGRSRLGRGGTRLDKTLSLPKEMNLMLGKLPP
jgi:hypothetical protein